MPLSKTIVRPLAKVAIIRMPCHACMTYARTANPARTSAAARSLSVIASRLSTDACHNATAATASAASMGAAPAPRSVGSGASARRVVMRRERGAQTGERAAVDLRDALLADTKPAADLAKRFESSVGRGDDEAFAGRKGRDGGVDRTLDFMPVGHGGGIGLLPGDAIADGCPAGRAGQRCIERDRGGSRQ